MGSAHPNFKHGGHSKYMPAGLKDRYLAALADENLLSLRQDVAIHEVHIDECCRRLETGECGTLWDDARAANKDLQDAVTNNDPAALRVALGQLDGLVKRGGDVHEAWKDLAEAIRDKADAVRAEMHRQQVTQNMIPAEQAVAIMMALAESVRRHAPAPAARAICTDLMKLFNLGSQLNEVVDGGGSENRQISSALPAPSQDSAAQIAGSGGDPG